MAVQIFIDKSGAIIATHDEANAVPLDTYDRDGKGGKREVRVIYKETAPSIVMIDGSMYMPRMKPGWEETHKDTIPASITSTQGRLALRKASLSKKVAEAIDAISDEDEREDVRIKFDSPTWKRSDPMFEKIGDNASPKITAEQFDNIFREARKL